MDKSLKESDLLQLARRKSFTNNKQMNLRECLAMKKSHANLRNEVIEIAQKHKIWKACKISWGLLPIPLVEQEFGELEVYKFSDAQF